MTDRDVAEKEFADADAKNMQKRVDELNRLVQLYQSVIVASTHAAMAKSAFKDSLKNSGFSEADIKAVYVLNRVDNLNRSILIKASEAKNA